MPVGHALPITRDAVEAALRRRLTRAEFAAELGVTELQVAKWSHKHRAPLIPQTQPRFGSRALDLDAVEDLSEDVPAEVVAARVAEFRRRFVPFARPAAAPARMRRHGRPLPRRARVSLAVEVLRMAR